MSDYYGSWRAMEELYQEGKIRAIGVCNFSAERLTDLCLNVRVIPAVNQIECHPFFQQKEALPTLKEFGVQMEAWGPLAEGQKIFSERNSLRHWREAWEKRSAGHPPLAYPARRGGDPQIRPCRTHQGKHEHLGF